MANLTKTVEILFYGTNKTPGFISGISKNFDQLSNSLDKAAQPLADIADSVIKVDVALAALAAGGMAVAVKQAGEFNDSFNEISTLTNASSDDLNNFKQDIINYARDSTSSFEDINAAIYTAISAGADYKDSLDLLNTSEKLSIAGKADLESTTKVLVSSLNAYGESTDKAAGFSDALFKTVKTGQTTLPELSTSLAQVSTTAANSGVSFDELMASIATVTATGAPTSQAITSIKAAISAIVKPSSEAAKEAEKLGLEFNASALATKGLDGVLKDVYSSTGGATEQIVKLFGSTESLPAVMTLGADASGKFAATLDEFKNKAGATAEAYSKMAENFSLTNQNLANNVKATFIQVGAELLGNYSDIVTEITDMFKGIGIGIDADSFKPLFDALDGVSGDIVKFLDELGDSIPEALAMIDWTGLIDALKELGGSFGDLFDGFDPADPKDVADAIQFVVNSIESLITITKGMVDSFGPFIDGILNSIEAFNRMDDADKEAAGNLLGLAKALTTLGAEITTILLLIGDNADKIEIFFDTVIGSIEMLWGGFKTTIQGVAGTVLIALDSILAGLEKVTWGDTRDKVKAMREGVDTEMKALSARFDDSVDQVNKGLARITGHIDPTELDGDLKEIETKLKDADFDIAPIPIRVETNFDAIQNDWDSITADIESFGVEVPDVGVSFKTTYKWTDSSGGVHITDTPPNPGEAIGDIETIKAPIGVDVDPKDIDKARDTIKKSFTKAEMGPINLGFDIGGGSGTGPAGGLQKAFEEMEPIPVGEVIDLGGLSDLLDSISSVENYGDRKQLTDEAIKIAKAQRELIQAEERNLNTRNAAISKEMQNITRMEGLQGDGDKTIKIDCAGVEPDLELLLFKILKRIQIRASESSAEFLLGAT